MNSGRFVLTQILDLIHWQTLSRLVSKYNAESKVRHFGVRQQLICMAFAQLTWRNGLRDIEACLNAKAEELYLMGFRARLIRFFAKSSQSLQSRVSLASAKVDLATGSRKPR